MGSLNERMARCEGVGNERQFEMRPQMGAFPKIANCKLPVLSNIERDRACSNIDLIYGHWSRSQNSGALTFDSYPRVSRLVAVRFQLNRDQISFIRTRQVPGPVSFLIFSVNSWSFAYFYGSSPLILFRISRNSDRLV